ASIPDQMMFKGLIPGGSDLNTYTTTGIYHQNSNANASSGTNYPVPYAGVLEVKHLATSFFYQTYTSFNGGTSTSYNNVFVRTYYNGNWSSWRRLLQNNDIAELWNKDRMEGTSVASADANTVLPLGGVVSSYSTSN